MSPSSEDDDDDDHAAAGASPTAPRFVVGLGASAGGLEALRPLIAALVPHGTTAYVVVQHMAPQHASILPDLLARDAHVVVQAAEHGVQLQPDHVYVTPPNCDAAVREGRIELSPPINTVGPKPSIDVLFTSLSRAYRERAVGVVLSGTGSDGTQGARAIKAQGGMVMSQTRASAKHDGMPAAVLRASVVDYELDIAELAVRLNALKGESALGVSDLPPPDEPGEPSPGELKQLLDLVYRATQLDFSQYKQGTLRRQIERRLLALQVPTLSEYVRIAENDPDELATLQRSFLISVTQFFRDTDAFDSLKQAVLRACERKPKRSTFRVWIPGCATGEEAYSIAMLVLECLGNRSADVELRVFATDIDNEATDYARAGQYPASALESVDPALRERYFSEDGGVLRVVKHLRDRCVFARQDVVRDAPFLRMDLVSCRNVLIYLRPELQEDVLGKFHYALNPGGLLFLGRSESVPNGSPLFGQIDVKNRLFARRSVPSPRTQLAAQVVLPRSAVVPPSSRAAAQQRVGTVHEILARSYAPPAILLGPSGEPSHFFGDSRRYVAFSEGNADFSFPSLVLPELRTEARTLLFRAGQGNEEELVGYPVRVHVGDQPVTLRLHVHKPPVDPSGAGERGLLVVFEELREPEAAVPSASADDAGAERLDMLQSELSSTREHLQAVIEELETSNEELQSLNEELQASSEELQASNEELQTTNEELQATNEELTTVNDELSVKSQESLHLSETLSNVQNSVQTGIVVVDRQGRILRYNRLAVRFFGIMPEDLGTSLYGLPSYVPLPELRAHVERAVLGHSALERGERDGLHFVVQFAPYLTDAGGCAGAVISLLDVTELRKAEMELARSERRFRHLADALDEVVWMRTREGTTLYVSPSFARLSGRPPELLLGSPDAYLGCVHPDDRPRVAAAHRDAVSESWLAEYRVQRPDGVLRHVEERGRVVSDEASAPAYLVSSLVDVTDRVHKEQALREGVAMSARLRSLADAVPGGLFSLVSDGDGVITLLYASPRLAELLGVSLGALTASPELVLQKLDGADVARLRASFTASLRARTQWEEELGIRTPDGGTRWLEVRAVVEPSGEGHGVMHGFCHDVSARKASAALLTQSEERYRTVYEQAFSGIAELTLDGRVRSLNRRFSGLLGSSPEALCGQPLVEHVHPTDRAVFLKLLTPPELALPKAEAAELRFLSADGRHVWMAVVVGPLRDGEGELRGFTCIASDVHGLKIAQAHASALNTELGHIVTSAVDPVISVDADQHVTVFNHAAERLFGLSAERVVGAHVSLVIPGASNPDHPFAQQALRADGLHGTSLRSERVEIIGRHADGADLPLEASFSYVSPGGSSRCTAIVRDIRERRAAERRILTLNEELAQLNRSLDARAQAVAGELSLRTEALERRNLELQQFAYVASHDLQTPLNGIAGFLELLELSYADKLDDRGRDWIGRAVESAHRLKQLIQGLLEFARMDNQAQRFVDVDLDQLCDELFAQLHDTPTARDATMTREPLPHVVGDRLQLVQLLQNLLSNALKYRTDKPVHVHVSCRCEDGFARISVSDDGIGVPPAYHERIFDMFKRLHDERAYPGTGIGLALCRRIVHRHGGQIGVSSTPDVGSSFWFTLPLDGAHARSGAAEAPRAQRGAEH